MAQTVETSAPAPFRAAFAPEDETLARALLSEAGLPPASERRIDAEAEHQDRRHDRAAPHAGQPDEGAHERTGGDGDQRIRHGGGV